MGIRDRVSASEVFMRLVRRRQGTGRFPGDSPEMTLHEKDVDRAYLMVKKMQRIQGNRPGTPRGKYYASAFAAVEKAYMGEDNQGFNKAISNLLCLIDQD